MGRNSKRNELSVEKICSDFKSKLNESFAQSTVEFAIVAVVVLILISGIASLMHKLDAGVFADHAITSSSHNITNSISGVFDVFVY